MLILLSPAKSLNEDPITASKFTLPALLPEAVKLNNLLKRKSKKAIIEMMHVSDQIAKVNYDRFRSFAADHTGQNSKPAIHTFDGDVYKGMDVKSFTAGDLDYSQKHMRILSGLYGVLRPLDLIQPYRLEMGTKLKNRRGTNLYQFWGDRITKQINTDLSETGSDLIINLASNEYYKSIQKKALHGQVLTINFKEYRNDKYIFVSFNAKRARGMMAQYLIKNKIDAPANILGFDTDGYHFNEELSSKMEYIFTK
ncbi:UNVERIFIED_CONTAM: hypothetical protein GTU68_047902 [Idotea baltica]|nr:hypothetical protein [Idotea baltica]